jgi:NADH dehydrogenase FAD-containing subunit
MKIDFKYIIDSKGQTTAVQLSLADWEKILSKLKKFEQTLKIKSGLKEAFEQVAKLKKSKEEKQTLKDFLNEI